MAEKTRTYPSLFSLPLSRASARQDTIDAPPTFEEIEERWRQQAIREKQMEEERKADAKAYVAKLTQEKAEKEARKAAERAKPWGVQRQMAQGNEARTEARKKEKERKEEDEKRWRAYDYYPYEMR